MPYTPSTVRGRALWIWSAGVLLLAGLVLLAHVGQVDPERLHVAWNFVDQAQYVTTARHWIDTGVLESGVVYPAHVEREGWRPYMPGSYLPLALSYRLFGASVATSLLPSLLGYLAAAWVAFQLANHFYGRFAGLAAALLFALFPPNAIYAFTAMVELPFAGICALLLVLFLAVPIRHRHVAMPLLLALGFLCRETAALLAIPMMALLLHPDTGRKHQRVRTAFLSLLVAVVLCALLDRWQSALGKGGYSPTWLTQGSFNYGDAFAVAPELSAMEWIEGIGRNFRRNLAIQRNSFEIFQWRYPAGSVGLFLVGTALALVGGLLRVRKDPWPLATALFCLALLASLFGLYDVKNQKAVRTVLFATPLLAVALSGLAAALLPRQKLLGRGRWIVTGVALLALVFLARFELRINERASYFLTSKTDYAEDAVKTLFQLGHDPERMLVAPTQFALPYSVLAYPSRASLAAENEETLDLIRERWDVGTLVLPARSPVVRISRDYLEEHSFVRVGLLKEELLDEERGTPAIFHVYRRL